MTCSGCSGAVERVLKKTDGRFSSVLEIASLNAMPLDIESYNVNLETQEVIVKGNIEYDVLLEKIKKTGKEVRSRQLSLDILLMLYYNVQVRSGTTIE